MRMVIRNDDDRWRFVQSIAELFELEKEYVAVFEPLRKSRSPAQNRTFHMWMAVMEKETGTSREVWKEMYKREFLEVFTDICSGKEITTVLGTSELNTKEFAEFMDKVRLHAIEHEGINLPLPGDQGYDEMILQYDEQSKYVR